MLVLTRKTGEAIELSRSDDGEVLATIVVTGRGTKIGISAPPEIHVVRTEIEQPQEEAA